jgi:hypothetical protein
VSVAVADPPARTTSAERVLAAIRAQRARSIPPGALAAAVLADAPVATLEAAERLPAPVAGPDVDAGTAVEAARVLEQLLVESGVERARARPIAHRTAARGWLAAHGWTSATEVAQRLGCTTRTLRRDQDALRALDARQALARLEGAGDE